MTGSNVLSTKVNRLFSTIRPRSAAELSNAAVAAMVTELLDGRSVAADDLEAIRRGDFDTEIERVDVALLGAIARGFGVAPEFLTSGDREVVEAAGAQLRLLAMCRDLDASRMLLRGIEVAEMRSRDVDAAAVADLFAEILDSGDP